MTTILAGIAIILAAQNFALLGIAQALEKLTETIKNSGNPNS